MCEDVLSRSERCFDGFSAPGFQILAGEFSGRGYLQQEYTGGEWTDHAADERTDKGNTIYT